MTIGSWLLLLSSLPCLLWTQGPDTAPALKEAGITQICIAVPPAGGAPGASADPADSASSWKAAGVSVTPLAPDGLAAREALLVPGVAPRTGVASPTRSPWINANGWRFVRNPAGKYLYEVPAGRAALAAAEAAAYGADAVLKIDPKDVAPLGAMLQFLATVPAADLPRIADIAVVDDGGPLTGEVMNLLSRRNLLFSIAKKGASASTPATPGKTSGTTPATTSGKLVVQLGTKEYPQEEAADPSAFALKVRRQLTDEQRTLRVYGSEVVVGHLTGDGARARLHVLNYGGRAAEGVRIRVRGAYRLDAAYVAGTGTVTLDDLTLTEGGTEFTLPRLSAYAVVDLIAAK